MRTGGEKIAVLTCYDASFATLLRLELLIFADQFNSPQKDSS